MLIQENLSIIEAYIKGSLSVEAEEEFRCRLKHDKALKDEFDFHLGLFHALIEQRAKQASQILDKIKITLIQKKRKLKAIIELPGDGWQATIAKRFNRDTVVFSHQGKPRASDAGLKAEKKVENLSEACLQ